MQKLKKPIRTEERWTRQQVTIQLLGLTDERTGTKKSII